MLATGIRNLRAQGISYAEFAPEPALAGDVEYFWTLDAEAPLAGPVTQTSSSKSTLDLIVPIEGHFCTDAERYLFGPDALAAYLVGPLSSPRQLHSTGRCAAVGVRFRPGRAQAFFRLPMHELTERVLPVDALSAPLDRQLIERAGEATGAAERVAAVAGALGERRSRSADDAASAAVRLIEAQRGNIRVEALASAVGTGVRTLERRFRETVGLGPKLACRIARVRHAITFLPRRDGVSWSEIVYACGFYDQAHFVREFRSVTGTTPTAFADGCHV